LVAYRPPKEDTRLWTLEAEWPGKGRVQSVENNVKIPAAALTVLSNLLIERFEGVLYLSDAIAHSQP